MQFDVITLFPEMFNAISQFGVTSRAFQRKLWQLNLIQLRDFANNRHGHIDDRPYGGGSGMVMRYQPLKEAIQHSRLGDDDKHDQTENPIRSLNPIPIQQPPPNHTQRLVIYLSPRGRPLNQTLVQELQHYQKFTLVCGRYEGIDQRVIDQHVDLEISLGDFILSGGELAAMCLMDSLIRQLPEALGNEESALSESFYLADNPNNTGLLEYPHYTRPPIIDDLAVPSILQSGNHQHIALWRQWKSLSDSQKLRPDLMSDEQEQQLLQLTQKVQSILHPVS